MNHVVNEGLNFEEENSSNNFSALLFKKQEENSVKTGRNLMGGGVSSESKPVEKGRGRIISNDAEMSMLTSAKVCYYMVRKFGSHPLIDVHFKGCFWPYLIKYMMESFQSPQFYSHF